MKRIAALVLVWILLASLLMACDGDTTPTPRQPIILAIVTATPDFIGPQPVASVSPSGPAVQPLPLATPK